MRKYQVAHYMEMFINIEILINVSILGVSYNGTFCGRYCVANILLNVPDDLTHIKLLKREIVLQELFSSSFKDVSYTNFLEMFLISGHSHSSTII